MKLLMQYLLSFKTDKLIHEVISKYLYAINPDHILTKDKHGIYLAGEKISEEEHRVIMSEVQYLKHSRLYNILNETLRKSAIDRLLLISGTDKDLYFAKAVLYNLDSINVILDAFYKPDFKTTHTNYLEEKD